MKYKIITKEELEQIYPNNYDNDNLIKYNINNYNTSFIYYYSIYRKYLDNYVSIVLNLPALNNDLKSINNNVSYNSVYRDISNLNLEYVFIRNNIFLDRLSSEEFLNLETLYKNNEEESLQKFVIETFPKLIKFDQKLSDNELVEYEINKQNHNNSLVICLVSNSDVSSILKKYEESWQMFPIPIEFIIYPPNEKTIFYIEDLYADKSIMEKNILKKYPKYLPIGSIVILKDGWKKIMITGYKPKDMQDEGKVYDYLGYLYPEGIINSNINILFNHEDIRKLIAIGLRDDEQKDFISKIEK